jgi:F1F0 ATPase subunit 2
MSDATPWLQLTAGFTAGALLGWLYFRALRVTVDRLPSSRRPGTVLLLSLVARAAVTVAVFALIARMAQGHGLAAALLGFIGTRTVIVRRARRETPLADSLRNSP